MVDRHTFYWSPCCYVGRAWALALILLSLSMFIAAPRANALSRSASAQELSDDPRDSASLGNAERVAQSAEAWEEKGEEAFFVGPKLAPPLRNASQKLKSYLAKHPSDVRALLLHARILRCLMKLTVVAVHVDEKGRRSVTGAQPELRVEALATLDKVIALEPNNAEAYYRKARVLSLSNPAVEDVDSGAVVEAARKAATLAPDNALYGEYFGLALLASGHIDEAVQQFQKLPGKHPALRLLDDASSIPLPAGATQQEAGIWADAFSGHLDIYKYPGLRALEYRVPLPLKDVVAFYTASLPTVKFKTEQRESVMGADAAFLWRGGQLEALPDPAVLMASWDKQLPPSGLLLMLAQAADREPVTTMIVIMNFRRF